MVRELKGAGGEPNAAALVVAAAYPVMFGEQ
jgi:hypothetical protein